MEKSPSIILSCLDKSVHEIMIHAGFMNRSGLYDGKIGVSLLLYYYSRFAQKKEIEAYAGHLVDEVFTAIAETGSFDLVPDIANIAWTVCHLTEQGFIEAELNEVLEDIDSFLWPSSKRALELWNIQNIADTGMYITGRIRMGSCKDVWCERGLAWLKEVETFIQKHGIPDIPVLLSVLACYRALQRCGIRFDLKGYFFENMPSIIKIAYLYVIHCETDSYVLHAFSKMNILNLSDNPLPFIDLTPSLVNINKFYLYQLLYGNFDVPDSLGSGISSIAHDQKRIGDLVSFANPQNIGLNNYLGGWSWALLQYCLNKGINGTTDRRHDFTIERQGVKM